MPARPGSRCDEYRDQAWTQRQRDRNKYKETGREARCKQEAWKKDSWALGVFVGFWGGLIAAQIRQERMKSPGGRKAVHSSTDSQIETHTYILYCQQTHSSTHDAFLGKAFLSKSSSFFLSCWKHSDRHLHVDPLFPGCSLIRAGVHVILPPDKKLFYQSLGRSILI